MADSRTSEQMLLIAALNDRARRAMLLLCEVHESPGFRVLPVEDRQVIRTLTANYNGWDVANNPFDEHDFGVVYKIADGQWTTDPPQGGHPQKSVYWKFAYTDMNMRQESRTPWDMQTTRRVLTFLLPSEHGLMR